MILSNRIDPASPSAPPQPVRLLLADEPLPPPVPALQLVDFDSLTPQIQREVRNREVYTPPISTFRWWARRSHTLFGALIDSVASTLDRRLLVVDPFLGGGTTLLESARRGHDSYGQDINLWAVRGVRAMMALPRVTEEQLTDATDRIWTEIGPTVERAYKVGDTWTTHAFRVATSLCRSCGQRLWLYPYALVSLDSRRPGEDRVWYACQRCGAITPGSRRSAANCGECEAVLREETTYLPGREVTCAHCGARDKISRLAEEQAPMYELVLVERARDGKRWFDRPRPEDLAAEAGWQEQELPAGAIAAGKETAVLLRHGFQRWRDLYPARQRAVLASILRAIQRTELDSDVRDLLTVAAVGVGEMAGLASPWDRYFLKAYEANANHRFAYVPFTAEVNVWGNETSGRGTFIRRMRQLRKAVRWFQGEPCRTSQAMLVGGSSQRIALTDGSADLVLTDPPYFGDVQYGELSGLFLSWLGVEAIGHPGEAVVDGRGKGAGEYSSLLAQVFREARRVAKGDGRLILTYHNRTPRAFAALATAFRQAGWRVLSWGWVPSENDRDFAKRDKQSCTMDLVIECVATSEIDRCPPPRPPADDVEADFLFTAGEGVADIVADRLAVREVESRLTAHPFLNKGKA